VCVFKKCLNKEYSTVVLNLLSRFVLTTITSLQKQNSVTVSNNWCGIVQVEVEPCDVWKQQSQDVLVR
jgi:hypothetical protein